MTTTPNDEAPPMGRDPMGREGVAELQERLRSALAANERDRTAYARFCESLRQWVRRWSWLTEGRGPYEWDDDRWHDEFGRAQREIKTIANRLEKNAHATDLRDCPTTQEEVEAARAAASSAPAPAEDAGAEALGEQATLANEFLLYSRTGLQTLALQRARQLAEAVLRSHAPVSSIPPQTERQHDG